MLKTGNIPDCEDGAVKCALASTEMCETDFSE